MTGMEVFLIMVGVVAIVGSIVFDRVFEKKDDLQGTGEKVTKIDEEELRKKVSQEIDNILEEKVEDTEGRVDKIMNEKMISMGEYSDTVLSDINKNHEEVMFIYGMLGDKEKEVKKTLMDIENVKKSVNVMEEDLEKKKNDLIKESQEAENNKNSSENSGRKRTAKNSESAANSKKKNNAETVENDQTTENSNEETVTETPKKTSNKKTSAGSKAKENASESASKQGDSQKKKGVAIRANTKKENNNDKILELSKAGMEPVDIAKKLKIGIGEVRLVIDLYNNR